MSVARRTGTAAVWGLLLLLITLGAIFLLFTLRQWRARSPKPAALPVLAALPEFTLTNQNSQPITLADLRGKVWVADIIFTRCAGPCPKMTQQMADLQRALAGLPDVRLVTLTTDPDYDTPPILQRYGERFKYQPARWHFLTGDKKTLARLAVGGLKLTAMEKDPAQRENEADLFIHSTVFAVVDKQGRLRGVVETQDDELAREEGAAHPAGMDLWNRESKPRLLEAVRQLAREPNP